MTNLKNKVVLVTGASRGAGAGIAKAFAAEGATVILTARNETALTKLQQEITNNGGTARAVAGDLGSRESCRKLAKECGHIDILVNNAAYTIVKSQPAIVEDDDHWDNEFQLNFTAPLTLMQSFIPNMIKTGSGVVLNISSISAQRGTPNNAPYASSKAALDRMSKISAMELAPLGVRVVVVALGMTETEALTEACPDGLTTKDLASNLIPLKRTVTVEEVGNLCVFLASDKAESITGTIVNIDGGITAGQYSFAGNIGR